MLREIFKKLLGEVNLGVLDYYRFPDRGNTWGGPFNGQEIRKQIYIDIIRMVKPEAIIETGTYQGTTTKLFANENYLSKELQETMVMQRSGSESSKM